MPEQDAVVAITADTNDMQGQLNLVWDKLLLGLRDKILPDNKVEQEKLRKALRLLNGSVHVWLALASVHLSQNG